MKRLAAALLVSVLSTPAFADTLIDNANGIQVDKAGRIEHFTGILISDDGKVVKILAPGDAMPAAKTRVDAGGKAMLPGLIDAHGHFMSLGFGALQLDLTGTTSLADLQQRLKAYAAANPDAKWILGRGWNQELWPDKKFPTAADLDAAVSDRPIWLGRVDGHASVANSTAMKSAGVTPQTKTPSGGRIENGLFVDAAQDLVDKTVPPPSSAELDQALAKAQEILLSYGITATAIMGTPIDNWNTMTRAGDAGRLQVRIFNYAEGIEPLRTVTKPTPWLYGDRLRMAGVKLYDDGALGSRGAWLKQPYSDMPNTRGLQFHSDAELLALADRAAASGFQVATHAIGDAANAQVIMTYEKLAKKYPGDRRWRIEHAQIVDPVDIPRIAKAGIIASMQPTHQTSDRLMAEARLGPDRLAGAYAWNTILKTGAHLAFGSDYPVESPNPFPGLAAAISRQDMNGQPSGGWRPQERVSLETALAGFTREAAYAEFAEDRIGALEPGKWADFIFVNQDPTKVDARALGQTQVLETWIAGKKVWQRAPKNAVCSPCR
jgi:predicted amidohydrolase YtcJ